jgi:hypothetical protein
MEYRVQCVIRVKDVMTWIAAEAIVKTITGQVNDGRDAIDAALMTPDGDLTVVFSRHYFAGAGAREVRCPRWVSGEGLSYG